MASAAREPGTGGGWGQVAGREMRGIWLHSLLSSPTSLSPRGGAGRGQCPVGRSGRGRWAGGPQPLSPGRRPAGPRVRLSSELTSSGGRWVPDAGHSRTSLSGHWAEQERAGQFLKRPRRATLEQSTGHIPQLARRGWDPGASVTWAEGGCKGGGELGRGRGLRSPRPHRLLSTAALRCCYFVFLSRPECSPSALCPLAPLSWGSAPRPCSERRGAGGAISGQAGYGGREGRGVKQSRTVKKQLRSKWRKRGKARGGGWGWREESGGARRSGQGGGSALYGQDSARKAGGESRDVIPQLYPAVTVGGEAGGGGKGEAETGNVVGTRRKKKRPSEQLPLGQRAWASLDGTRAGAEGGGLLCGLRYLHRGPGCCVRGRKGWDTGGGPSLGPSTPLGAL